MKPANDAERIAALEALDILDTPPDPKLDAITDLATDMFKVPVSLVSLVDEHRQWFKSNCGLAGVSETAREVAFCDHAIRNDHVMVVENALEDPRFKENALVTGDPLIRFYAGCPLILPSGHAIGTLCLIDFKPRTLSENEEKRLIDLASIAMGLIENHHLTRETTAIAKRLRETRDQLRLVLDNVPARIWYKDDKNTIIHANRAALESVNLSDPSEVEGRPTAEIFPEMADKYLADDLEVIRRGEPVRNIIESYAPIEGQDGWISTDKVPMRDSEGRDFILAVATDISELKQKEEQLQRLNESLADFAFVAAHDLQAPLRQSAMFMDLLLSELAEQGVTFNENSAEFADEVVNGLARMRSMVKNLYDLFRLDVDDASHEFCDLGELSRLAAKQSESLLNEKGASVEIADLPTLKVNKSLIIQLLQNLMTNACRYSAADDLKISISASRDIRNRKWNVRVDDNGVGIPAHLKEKIFEPFKRLHHKDEVEGAGVGLALCRRIASLHQADIYVDENYNDGARFVISFGY